MGESSTASAKRNRASGGLRIERVWTTEGAHPFDEVSWERRDVVMTNWRDGSINFEQHGVEFPDFWSVNATNIVTTKYFRGAVGTPEREWSLKQLIGRVVKTYRAAGEKHGYFATADDAEVFEHELAWMLLHQVFSFNSPVWFNVGTASPQQVSACQPYDALVSTPSGLIPIGRLVEEKAVGTKVYDAHGLTKILAVKANGVKEVLRLHTKAGYTLDVTADHLVWKATGDGTGHFVEAGSLKPGDQLEHHDIDGDARAVSHAQIARIVQIGAMEVYDIQTESGEYLSGNLRVHNCFILSVDDSVDSIMDWYKEEGLIFKGGSGSGINLSRIRSSKELLSSGGTASGPVSFMRGADASAGTIKSGGATRRAAKMVILDVDHPDIEEFIVTKAREEDKIRALRDAGFDMDLGGTDIVSVQYQNANNSVRVSDEFMAAVQESKPFDLVARLDGSVIKTVDAKTLFRSVAQAAWECADPGVQYDDTINHWHTCSETGRITASNPCSEYLSLDDTSCNLASLNLMKFLKADGTFDIGQFTKSVELVITAMDISICFADFPTVKITENTRAYRQLGIGYANLGALLMASGLPYDSDGGRSLAGAITALMTGAAYRRSAELAAVVGAYDGYARNALPHKKVMALHAEAAQALKPQGVVASAVAKAAQREWQAGNKLGEKQGWRNAQASVLAPTGCLTGDSLVPTDRGLMRLSEIGDVYGDRWQGLEMRVSTDEGPRQATKFFVNGEEPTRRIVTEAGYRIQGTLAHRIKVVDRASGEWVWRRLADIAAGDLVPMQMKTLVGGPRRVPMPVLDQAYYTGDRGIRVPEAMDTDLAELVGYFMGDGSLHARGIRLCVSDADLDVVERLRILSKGLFAMEPVVTQAEGYQEVVLQSVRLARWWKAAGFAKDLPGADHSGKGWTPRVPSAVLESNDAEVYASFLRGLFEADGSVTSGVPALSTASDRFAAEVSTLLLTLGIATTTRKTQAGWGDEIHQVRVRNLDHALTFDETVGFLSDRKNSLLIGLEPSPSGYKKDRVYLPVNVWEELIPAGHRLRNSAQLALKKSGGVSRFVARRVFEETFDARLGHALGYLFEAVNANEDGGIQPTYDLSVPDNVTYVASGFVSHNTIGFMMDCDTTGVEPDLALVKFKKLVGGGSMQIVNQTVPRALRNLGYQEEQIEAITEFIAAHGHVVDAPGLRNEHYAVFDCAMGERSIEPMGHVLMMAAVQPFISGAISKTVNMPETATVEDVEKMYFDGWKLGLKALAIYRDNCKVGQPLSVGGKKTQAAALEAEKTVEKVIEYRPVRKRLPKKRPSQTVSFAVGDAEGYLTASSYPDDGLGEVFLKLGKQGSTLAGVMDAFSIAVSVALQYGVPLRTYVEKFMNMKFEPAGMTDDSDIRIANSVMDYIFRRLALDFLPYEQRAELGVFTASERRARLEAEEAGVEYQPEVEAQAQPVPSGRVGSSTEALEALIGKASDAPLCYTCGTKMRPAGSCYVCEGCGSTSGCS